MNAYDKIEEFLEEYQYEELDQEGCDDFGDLTFEFINDDNYTYYGYKIMTNVFQLNFSGTSDWFYFISIEDKDMKTYKKNLDQYPIYFVNLEDGTITREGDNFKEFMKRFFEDGDLKQFSDEYLQQDFPKILQL